MLYIMCRQAHWYLSDGTCIVVLKSMPRKDTMSALVHTCTHYITPLVCVPVLIIDVLVNRCSKNCFQLIMYNVLYSAYIYMCKLKIKKVILKINGVTPVSQ